MKMKRSRIFALTLVFLLTIASGAAAKELDTKLIGNAKQALTLMSYGEYGKALKKLNFASNVETQTLQDFAESEFENLYDMDVQTEVSVAWKSGDNWIVAVPLEEPAYRSVQVFALRSKNGTRFDAYKAMTWGEVLDNLEKAKSTIWKNSYEPESLTIVPDD